MLSIKPFFPCCRKLCSLGGGWRFYTNNSSLAKSLTHKHKTAPSALLILCSCIIASHPAPRGRGAKGRCVKRKHKSYFSLHATFASRHNPIGPHNSRPRCNWSKSVCFDSNASRQLGWCWGFGGLYYIRLEMLCFGRC